MIRLALPLTLAAALFIPADSASMAQQQNTPSALEPADEIRPSSTTAAPTTAPPEQLPIKIFTLVNSKADDSARLLIQLFANEGIGIQPDHRTNTIVVRGPEETLLKVEAILMRLDAQESRPDAALPAGRRTANPAVASPLRTAAPARTPGENQRHGQEAAQLAGRYQQAAGDQREELKSQLQRAVEAAFEARQQSQRAELAQLRERFSRIEESLATREKVKDKIVANRVAELLDPNLQWEPEAESPSPAARRTAASATNDPYARDPAAASSDAQFSRRHWPSTTTPGGNVILRSAEEFGRELNDTETATHNQKLFERGFVSQSKVIADQRRLKAIQDEYAAQIKLLELELQNAEATLLAANAQFRRAQQSLQVGATSITASEVDTRRLQVEQAQIRLEQLKTLLDLYRAAGKTDDDAKTGTVPGAAGSFPGGGSSELPKK